MTSYTRCFAWSGNPWRTKEKWTRGGKYINGGCLSKRHAQAAYQKQNRSREPPRSPSFPHTLHLSIPHTPYKRLFIVNTETVWWKRISLPPFIIFRRYYPPRLSLPRTRELVRFKRCVLVHYSTCNTCFVTSVILKLVSRFMEMVKSSVIWFNNF